MKKLLLVIMPAVLLLTSCLKSSSDDYTPDPLEVQFYNGFVQFNNHARLLINVAEEYIDKYEKDGAVVGMTVVNNEDGTFKLVIDFDMVETSNYRFYQGQLAVVLTGSSVTNSETTRVIDLSGLKYTDGYYTYKYKGSIRMDDNGMGDPNSRMEDISLTNFSIGTDDEVFYILNNYTYNYMVKGLATPNDTKDDTYTWSNGYGSGSNVSFDSFTVRIDFDIVKKGALEFTSQGKYTFSVSKIGALPFSAEYGKGGEGMVTITSADGLKEYSYNQLRAY